MKESLAEEAGVEPTKPVLQTSPGLKSGHPTGDDTLPPESLSRGVCRGHPISLIARLIKPPVVAEEADPHVAASQLISLFDAKSQFAAIPCNKFT